MMFKGAGPAACAEDDILRKVRGNDITMIFQEPMTSLNPLHTIEQQIGEVLLLHGGVTGRPARTRIARAADAGRHPASRRRGSAAIRTSSPAASASA